MGIIAHRVGWGLGLVVLLVAGCATAPPKRSLSPGDLKAVAGQWTGRFDSQGVAGPYQHVFVIREDGTFLETGGVRSSGSVEIRNGDIVFAGTQTRGTVGLYEEGAVRYLIGEGQVLDGPILNYTGLGSGRYAIRLKASP